MKKIIIILILFPFFLKAQSTLPEIDGKVCYTDVVYVDSAVKKDELFNRALIWIVSDYGSSKDALQLKDKNSGLIVIKDAFPAVLNTGMMGSVESVPVSYTLKLYFKDGKYKYEITDISLTNEIPNLLRKPYTKMLKMADDTFKNIIYRLEQAMSKSSSTDF